jgi:DNA repair photolyase
MIATNPNPALDDHPPPPVEPTQRDGLAIGSDPSAAPRGRASTLNPANRFQSLRLHVLDEDAATRAAARAELDLPTCPQVPTRVLPDNAQSVLNRVDSPDIHFEWTLNPYRGCEHGCIYCYARPGHEYFGLSLGLDFETTIFAKHDAPSLLERELSKPSWRGEPIVISGVTDPYQPCEKDLAITRRCLEVCARFRQPVSVITKSALIARDVDLLSSLARHNACRVAISLTTLDNTLARAMEPRAAAPRARLKAMRVLADAGVPVTVMTAPIIPGLNDREIPALLGAARRYGASAAGYVLLRLPHQLKDLFLAWLAKAVPDKATRIEALLRDTRGGMLYDHRRFVRHTGEGPLAQHIGATFRVFARRYGLDTAARAPLSSAAFRTPRHQLDLFATDDQGIPGGADERRT